MGLFDTICCAMPLPGVRPAWLREDSGFQTKDLDCTMTTYHIAPDGSFSDPGYTGVIVFYNSNIVATGPGLYTRIGEDAESVEYEATVVGGVVQTLKQTEYQRQYAMVSGSHPPYYEPSKDLKSPQEYFTVGKRLYCLYGGQDIGAWVRVVYVGTREVAVEYETANDFSFVGTLETMSKAMLHLLWLSEEEAQGERQARVKYGEVQREEYQQGAREWASKRSLHAEPDDAEEMP